MPEMAESGGTVEIGNTTIVSSTESADEIRAAFEDPKPAEDTPEPDPSSAASVLGKKGGEASAAIKRAQAREAKKNAKEAGAEGGDEGDRDGVSRASEVEPDPAEGEAPKDKKGNPRHDPQARVAQATREAKEAREALETERRAREAAERRAYDLERSRQPQEQPKPKDGPPEESDFDNWRDFVRATTRYELAQERAEQAKRQQIEDDKRAEKEYLKPYSQTVTEYAKSIGISVREFWMDRVSPEVREIKPTYQGGPYEGRTWIADYLIAPANAEHAPALMLHLSEHPEDFQRIAALSSSWHVIRELAKLEPGPAVETTATNAKPTVSRATPPVRPVTGSPVTDSSEPDENAPLSAFVHRFGQRELASRR